MVTCVDTSRTCVDTSSFLYLVNIHCLHMSTLRSHVSIIDHQSSKVWLLFLCVDTSSLLSIINTHYLHVSILRSHVSIIDHKSLKGWPLSLYVDTSMACVNTFNFLDTILMCLHLEVMCRPFTFRLLTIRMC